MIFPRPTFVANLIARQNRFVGEISLHGKDVLVHIPNTGPIKGVLHMPQQALVMESLGKLPYQLQALKVNVGTMSLHTDASDSHSRPAKRTSTVDSKYHHAGEVWVGIHSSLANNLAREWIAQTWPRVDPKAEVCHKDSRFDFGWQEDGKEHILEVKSVSLVENGIAMFPDTPSPRANKHLEHIIKLEQNGVQCHVLFVIQRPDAGRFMPAAHIDPKFAQLLTEAAARGTTLHATTCDITLGGISLQQDVPVDLVA